MELLFESTAAFERDLAALCDADRESLIEAINRHCPLLACDQESFFAHVYQPRAITLQHDCCSSLYVLPADPGRAIILTIDDDPIFEQTVITLLCIVPDGEIETAYTRTARALYRHWMREGRGGHG
mgnify:CR=1 FL=1|jgi:hypothetical protein